VARLGFESERKDLHVPSAQHSVIVDRPIDEVFASCSEPTNEFKWRSQVKEITTEGPAAVGRRVHQAVKGPGGLRIPADIEVAGFEPAARYAFRGVAGPIRPVGEFLFSAKEEHTCFVLLVGRADGHQEGAHVACRPAGDGRRGEGNRSARMVLKHS
jgi:hypothetical protein